MEDVFIATEPDGSKWVHLEDYQVLMQKYLISELALEEQIKRSAQHSAQRIGGTNAEREALRDKALVEACMRD